MSLTTTAPPLPDAEVVQSGPLVPTRGINMSAGANSTHSIYHEVDQISTRDKFRCHYVDAQYEIPLATICAFYLLFGIIYSVAGYRCFKSVMFMTGFLFGASVVYIICIQEELLPYYGNAGVALSAGILFGLITMLVQYVGLFMTGFHTGVLLSVVGVIIAEQTRYVTSVWVITAILLAGGLFFAVCNLYWKKGLTIIGTAIYGGALGSMTLDYFVERFAMWLWMWSRIAQKPSPPPCWFGWLVLGVWPFLIMVGIILQFAVTGIGVFHDDMTAIKGAPVQRVRTREQRAELRQKKYRYLYQVRTAHGDVISQNFVQALQRRALTPQGDTNTLQSDSTHVSHLPGETGEGGEQAAQLAALTESEDDLLDGRDAASNSASVLNFNMAANYR